MQHKTLAIGGGISLAIVLSLGGWAAVAASPEKHEAATTTTTTAIITTTTSTTVPPTTTSTTLSPAVTSTTVNPSNTTTTVRKSTDAFPFAISVDVATTMKVGEQVIASVHLKNLGEERDYAFETRFVNSSGTIMTATGDGGHMTTGASMDNQLQLGCYAAGTSGVCPPGIYKLHQLVMINNTKIVTDKIIATIHVVQ